MSDEAGNMSGQDDYDPEIASSRQKRKTESGIDDGAPGAKRQKQSESAAVPLKKRFQQAGDNDAEDKDEDSDFQEEADPYDSDGYIDEADRMQIDSLPAMERENVMLERQEERKRIRELNRMRREQWEARRRSRGLSITPKSAAAAKKSESSRKKAALNALAARHQQKKPAPKPRRDLDEDIYDDEDDRDEDDMDDGDYGRAPRDERARSVSKDSQKRSSASAAELRRSPPPPMIREPLATYEDIKKAQVTRPKMVKWCGEPYFEKAIKGVYIRVPVGADPNDPNKQVYRVASVTDIQDASKVYSIGSGKSTDKRLLATIGHNSRAFNIDGISASEITAEEFETYQKFMKKSSISLPTKREIDGIIRQIKWADDYRYSSQEVQEMISKSGFKNINRQKVRTDLELQLVNVQAQEKPDEEAIKRIQAQLADLDAEDQDEMARLSASKRKVDLDTPKNKTSLLAEVTATRSKGALGLDATGKPKDETANPFMRRRTLQDSGWAQMLVSSHKPKPAEPAPAVGSSRPDTPTKTESAAANSIIASVWDDIDAPIVSPPIAPVAIPSLPAPAPQTSATPKKTFSLADYNKLRKP